MNITYKWVNWTFNTELWTMTIKHAIEIHGVSDLAQISELDESTLLNWSRGRYTREFRWPHMLNFLKLTNLLDLNPSVFFVLESE